MNETLVYRPYDAHVSLHLMEGVRPRELVLTFNTLERTFTYCLQTRCGSASTTETIRNKLAQSFHQWGLMLTVYRLMKGELCDEILFFECKERTPGATDMPRGQLGH